MRAVIGLPLGDPSMKVPAAIMYNILGEDEVTFETFQKWLISNDWLQIYRFLFSYGIQEKRFELLDREFRSRGAFVFFTFMSKHDLFLSFKPYL